MFDADPTCIVHRSHAILEYSAPSRPFFLETYLSHELQISSHPIHFFAGSLLLYLSTLLISDSIGWIFVSRIHSHNHASQPKEYSGEVPFQSPASLFRPDSLVEGSSRSCLIWAVDLELTSIV